MANKTTDYGYTGIKNGTGGSSPTAYWWTWTAEAEL